jgi:DNA mismatch repair ATPase MutS
MVDKMGRKKRAIFISLKITERFFLIIYFWAGTANETRSYRSKMKLSALKNENRKKMEKKIENKVHISHSKITNPKLEKNSLKYCKMQILKEMQKLLSPEWRKLQKIVSYKHLISFLQIIKEIFT